MEADEPKSSGFASFIQRDNNYRTSAQIESSDNSDSSDEDAIYSSKRPRNLMLEEADRGKVFINPNYHGEIVRGPCSPLKKFRKNNIWGSILQEQSVSEGISRKIQVDHDSDIDSDNVESYNYKTKLKDTRPEVEDDVEDIEQGKTKGNASFTDKETFGNEDTNNRKRSYSSRKSAKDRLGRQNLRERIGARTYDKTKERPHISVTAADSTGKIVNELVNVLNEPKVELLTRVVETIGAEKSLELLYMTEDIEEAGGMMVNNGSRRRTPGGVFLQLLRTDADIEREKVNVIFKDEKDEYRKKQRRKKARKAEWKRHQINEKISEMGPKENVMQEEVNQNDKAEDAMITETGLKSNEDIEPAVKTYSDLEEGEISE